MLKPRYLQVLEYAIYDKSHAVMSDSGILPRLTDSENLVRNLEES